jgi:hypothetical protein
MDFEVFSDLFRSLDFRHKRFRRRNRAVVE